MIKDKGKCFDGTFQVRFANQCTDTLLLVSAPLKPDLVREIGKDTVVKDLTHDVDLGCTHVLLSTYNTLADEAHT